MLQRLEQSLKAKNISAQHNILLAPYTSFQIGGYADLFIEPKNNEELKAILTCCKQEQAPYFILGKGPNVLFSDEGFRGVILYIGDFFSEMHLLSEQIIYCGAGASLNSLCLFAAENGLSGLEFAYGIPGSVGGGIFMNAGAYGGEIKDVVNLVDFIDAEKGKTIFLASELAFSYRHSVFQGKDGCIVGAEFSLQKGERPVIKQRMQEIIQKRIEKQPLNLPSAGSAFKRPQGAYASALIEQCGLKGYRVGGAAISEKHAGFIVNLGGATCNDVLAVADDVVRIVKEKTGYLLEKEIRVITG